MTVGISALGVLLPLLLAASPEAEVSLRAESRSTRLDPDRDPAVYRESLIVQPRLEAWLEAERMRLSGRYQPRIWTSDVEKQRHPAVLVEHSVAASIETRRPSTWEASATATATRGRTDPLADALAAATSPVPGQTGQLATARPLDQESLSGAGRASLQLDLRTTVGGGASWSYSRGSDAEARALLPTQRTTSASADVAYLVSPRDTLRLSADGSWSETEPALAASTAAPGPSTATVRATFATVSATWRRRLTPILDGSVGGGGSLSFERTGAESSSRRALPYAHAGLARAADQGGLGFQLTARYTPAFDRIDGRVHSTIEGIGLLTWTPRDALTLTTTATGARRTDGQTWFGAGEIRAVWGLRERLALELGLVARWHHDNRPGVSSFSETGATVALAWAAGTAARGRSP